MDTILGCMETILRSEAKKIIDSGMRFSLAFVKADRRRGEAGEYVQVNNWQKVQQDPAPEAIPGQPALKKELARDPSHQVHKTFNIFNPADRRQHPVKVHYRLMHIFNDKIIVQ